MNSKHRVVISGYGIYAQCASDASDLIAGIHQGRRVTSEAYTLTADEMDYLALPEPSHYVPLPVKPTANRSFDVEFILPLLKNVIEETRVSAGLSTQQLTDNRLRTYLSGIGMRADMADFMGYQDCNDSRDLRFSPQLKTQHSRHYGQDVLMHKLRETFGLYWSPVPIYSASSSSTSALHIGSRLIENGIVDKVLIAGWMNFTLQDLFFMALQGLLSSTGDIQPFSATHGGILPSNGVTAMLLESEQSLRQRGREPEIVLHSSASFQSSGTRSGIDFRAVASTLQQVVEQSGLNKEEFACAMPHGNGMPIGDKAEVMGIQKVWGERGIPVVSYKSQMGYFSTCSGIVDLMIAADALRNNRLIAFQSQHPLDDSLMADFHVNREAATLRSPHIIKSSIGIDGSILACAVSRYDALKSANNKS